MIEEKLEEQGVRIKKILKHSHQKINLYEGIPKLTILINHEEWFVEDIKWGITNRVIFQALAVEQWYQFPTMIKTMLSYLVRNLKWGKCFTFWITSSVGWRAKEKFFQPYQLWLRKASNEEEFDGTKMEIL
jgi:hypothetical protein